MGGDGEGVGAVFGDDGVDAAAWQGHHDMAIVGRVGDVWGGQRVAETAHRAVGRGDCDLHHITRHRTRGQGHVDLDTTAINQLRRIDAGCDVDALGQGCAGQGHGCICTVRIETRRLGVHRKARALQRDAAIAVGEAQLRGLCAVGQVVHGGSWHAEQEGVGSACAHARLHLGGVRHTAHCEADGRAHLRIGGTRNDQVLAALCGVDVAIARKGVERDDGRRAEDVQLVATDVGLGHAAGHHRHRHVVGAVGQRREATDGAGVQAPSFSNRVIAQARRHGVEGAGEGLTIHGDCDAVGACQGDVVAGDGWVCARRDELGSFTRQCGRGCISTVGHDAMREQVVHAGHIGVGGVDKQTELIGHRGVACHVHHLHADGVSVAVVERLGIGLGQRDRPRVEQRVGIVLHGGSVGHAIERDLHTLPHFGVGRAFENNRHSNGGGSVGLRLGTKAFSGAELARGGVEHNQVIARDEGHHQRWWRDVQHKVADAVGGIQTIALARDVAGEGVVAVFVHVGAGHGQGDAAVGQVLCGQHMGHAAQIAIRVFEREGQDVAHAGTGGHAHHGLQTVEQFRRTDTVRGFSHRHRRGAGQPVDGVDQRLQFAQGVHGAGIAAQHRGVDGGKNAAQIGRGDVAQADGGEVSRGQSGDRGLAQAHLHHALGDAGEVQDLGGAVYAGRTRVVEGVVEELTFSVEGHHRAEAQGGDVGVVQFGACARGGIGQSTNLCHGVDQGLHFGGAVDRAAVDGGGVEHVIDEGHIGRAHAGDACVRVQRGGQQATRDGAVVASRCDDGIEGVVDVVHRGLQGGLGEWRSGRGAAVGGFERGQDGCQVGLCDA